MKKTVKDFFVWHVHTGRYSQHTSFIKKTLKKISQSDILKHSLLQPLHSTLVEVSCVTELEMQKLNKQFRKKDSSTDVLTFTYNETSLLGEIFISIPDISLNAQEHNNGDINAEIRMVLVHASLHMIGYDHSPEMFSLQDQYVNIEL